MRAFDVPSPRAPDYQLDVANYMKESRLNCGKNPYYIRFMGGIALSGPRRGSHGDYFYCFELGSKLTNVLRTRRYNHFFIHMIGRIAFG